MVTVNAQNAWREEDGYFYAEVPVDNTQGDVLEEIKIVATRAGARPQGENILSEEEVELCLLRGPESFQYDDDAIPTPAGRDLRLRSPVDSKVLTPKERPRGGKQRDLRPPR